MTDKPLPQRRKLPHEVPSWVQQGARHFFTVNCRARGKDSLIGTGKVEGILDASIYYDQIERWYLWLLLVMPDHVHGIATFDLQHGIRKSVAAWKGFLAKRLKIDWQSGFFEHRLRTIEEFDQKAAYVRMNPVRCGLVENIEKWPWVLDRSKTSGRANPPGEPGSGSAEASPYRGIDNAFPSMQKMSILP